VDLEVLIANHQRLLGWGIQLYDDAEAAPWDDHSYLSAEELKQPGIQASVRSATETNRLIAFVGQTEDREYFGYWLGPEGTPVAEASVVIITTESTYMAGGRTLAEALARWVYDEDFKQELVSLGLSIGPLVSGFAEANDYRDTLFERYLAELS